MSERNLKMKLIVKTVTLVLFLFLGTVCAKEFLRNVMPQNNPINISRVEHDLQEYTQANPICSKIAFAYRDLDGDGYGNYPKIKYCVKDGIPEGYVSNKSDCNDDPETGGGLYQIIQGYVDADGDGHGIGELLDVCSGDTILAGYTVLNNTDCNDLEYFIHNCDFTQKLTAVRFVYFGRSVSISGNRAIVGTIYDDAGYRSGSAYIFRFNEDTSTWEEEIKLTASDAATKDHFGISVSISGDIAIVGTKHDIGGGNPGSAYIYRFNEDTSTWIETKLTASDAAPVDWFGISVSIFGDRALVGARLDDDGGSASGSAYIFRFNEDTSTWEEEIKLTASDAAEGDNFGNSVSLSGNTVIIGAFGNDDGGSASGSAYIFRFNEDTNTWEEEIKLTASDAASVDWFGYSVSISGDRAIVGAYRNDDGGDETGSAYIFTNNGSSWVETKLTASDGEINDNFGYSVSISGDIAFVGAPKNDDGGDESGSAYIFDVDQTN